MMRALWSGASGMIAQQKHLDSIANNLANVNTVGFKNERTEFKSLLYQTIQTRSTSANGATKPIGAQVGLGTRTASITTEFRQGAFEDTGNELDFAISGDGFFQVEDGSGDIYYTRDGSFNLVPDENGRLTLVTSDGWYVLDSNGNHITYPQNVTSPQVYVDANGNFAYATEDGTIEYLNQQLALYQFANPAGLEKIGSNCYNITEVSGDPMQEGVVNGLITSTVRQGYLEMSSVSVADEMVDMIVTQRAYEMNSKAITTADTMMEQANQLKR